MFELSFPRRAHHDQRILRYNTVAFPGIQLPIISITIVSFLPGGRQSKKIYVFNSLLNKYARGNKKYIHDVSKYKCILYL
jgi:hypothetical protein